MTAGGGNPYLIEGPALISFSGGRTSAFMLWSILQAHGGTLPDDVVVAFANTGKEREETLRFVHDVGSRWGVRIHWLEWRVGDQGKPGFEEVGFNSASRRGEPFAALIARRGKLPNPRMRFCSRDLKVEVINWFCRSLGWDRWCNVLGLRHDEGARLLRKYAENATSQHRWKSLMPMDKAQATRRDVMAFWWGAPDATFETRSSPQGFDLDLRPHEGNCDLCFLKSRGKLLSIMRDRPAAAGWWIDQEARAGRRFERDRSYAQLAADARSNQLLPFDDFDEHDAECGLLCESEPA